MIKFQIYTNKLCICKVTSVEKRGEKSVINRTGIDIEEGGRNACMKKTMKVSISCMVLRCIVLKKIWQGGSTL